MKFYYLQFINGFGDDVQLWVLEESKANAIAVSLSSGEVPEGWELDSCYELEMPDKGLVFSAYHDHEAMGGVEIQFTPPERTD